MDNGQTSKIAKFLSRYEPLIFLIFAVLSLIPLFLTWYVASLDGPKHLTTSNVIGRLLSGENLFQTYFHLNPVWIGNLGGVYLLSILNLFFPAWLAEKLFIATYLLTFVYGFRFLITAIHGKPVLLSLLVFPFTHSSLFMMGYYNFSLGIALMFFSLGWYLKYSKSFTTISLISFGALVLLTYLTHLFVFYTLLLMIALHFILELFAAIVQQKPINWSLKLSISLTTFLAVVPALVLSAFYLIDIMDFQQSEGFRPAEANKFADLINFRMLVGYDFKAELPLTKQLFYFLVLLTVITFFFRLLQKKRETKWHKSDIWMFVAFAFLFLYFVLPDGADAAGSVGLRLLILTAILWVVWLSKQQLPAFIQMISLVFVLYFGISTRSIHHKFLKPLDNYILQIEAFEKKIPDESQVVTMNFTKNWLMHYFHNYIGMEKALVDFRGNSASRFMAFNWNAGKPDVLRNASEMRGFTGYPTPGNKHSLATYVVIVEYRQFIAEETQEGLRQILKDHYTLSEVSDNQFIAMYTINSSSHAE